MNYELIKKEIAEIAFVVADVARREGDDHRLHQTFDICEEGNIDRVNSLLDLAFAEVLAVLSDRTILSDKIVISDRTILSDKIVISDGTVLSDKTVISDGNDAGSGEEGATAVFGIPASCLGSIPANRLPLVRETVKEFLISRVLYGWLSVTLPEAAPEWERRAEELLSRLSHIRSSGGAVTRRSSPF